ncbi:uncharacterized protein LOC120330376 [Styela clava]
MEVICAGFPKTGTKSIARALRLLGYDIGNIGLSVQSTDINRVLDEIYAEDVKAVVDFPHSFFFEYFYRKWPNAKVILMIRDEDRQFASFKNMLEEGDNTYWIQRHVLSYFCKSLRRIANWRNHMFMTTMGSSHPNELKWKEAYRRHNAYVKSAIPEEKLLIYNVSEGWEPICKFLDKPVPLEEFPFENKAGSKDRIVVKMMSNSRVVRDFKRDLMNVFVFLPVVICTVLGCCYLILN